MKLFGAFLSIVFFSLSLFAGPTKPKADRAPSSDPFAQGCFDNVSLEEGGTFCVNEVYGDAKPQCQTAIIPLNMAVAQLLLDHSKKKTSFCIQGFRTVKTPGGWNPGAPIQAINVTPKD
ncbi:MAG: hypothetical protein AB7O96_11485 [Pseudobdellovibrionaceae bacterium]